MPKHKDTAIETEPQLKPFQLNKTNTDALKELLQRRLIDCGWRANVRQMIQTVMEERGIQNVTYDQIAAEIIPQARALVPEAVRKELQLRVMESLESSTSYMDEDQ